MQEFLDLGHMETIPPNRVNDEDCFYLTHHPVWKEDGSRKLRVVFNGSQKDSKGLSLNDCLFTGPNLLADLSAVIANWRFFQFVFSADIIKMFRKIGIDKRDRTWQRIVWRDSPDQPIQDFWINTVIYGLRSSSYQANETRFLLAKQEKHNYFLGADILEHRTYMDDSFGGGDDLESAEKAKQQLIDILLKADMHLDKWSANHVSLLPLTDSNNKELTFVTLDVVSTLGLSGSLRLMSLFFL